LRPLNKQNKRPVNTQQILEIYRLLPWFRGKLRIGKKLFGSYINKREPLHFTAHGGIEYSIPNTLENLGMELLINGVYEQDIVRFLQAQVPDGAVYFDIGANIGSLGLPVVKLKSNVRYYGFEASPMVFEYLQKNFEQNGILHFQLFNKLVHQNDAQLMKFYESELYGKSSLAPTYTSDYIEVDSVSLDGFCRQQAIKKIDWMKVDVQGFELYVFEGMQQMLKEKNVENILFEFEAWADEQAGVEIGAAQSLLQEWGYCLYGLDGKRLENNKRNACTMIWAKPNV